jgi:WD40 repeat protein
MLVWKAHRSKVRALAFAPNGGALASIAGESQFVWLWEAHTGTLLRKLKNPANGYPVRAIAFLPDGKHLAGLHERLTATVWDADGGAVVAVLNSGHRWYSRDCLAVAPDGTRLLVYSNGALQEWDEPARPAPTPRAPDRSHPQFGHTSQYGFSPRGRWLYRLSLRVSLYDAGNLAVERDTFSDPQGSGPTAVAFTPDETRLCVAFGHRALVWRLDDRAAPPLHLRGHAQQVRAVGFPPGGGTVFTAGSDGTVRVWDANTGAETRAFDWGVGSVRAVCASPDGAVRRGRCRRSLGGVGRRQLTPHGERE